MLTARDSLAAAEWLRLVGSPGSELESAAAAQLSEPGGDPKRRQIAGDLLRWARGLAAVEPQARDQSEAVDLRTRRRRLAAAAAVTARGLDGWQTVQHAVKLDRWPSKWLLEARASAAFDALRGSVPAEASPMLFWWMGTPLQGARADLERLRKAPDDLVFSNGAWGAPAREGLLSLLRTLGAATAVDDAILQATLGKAAAASDGASQSQAGDVGPKVAGGAYSATTAVVDSAKEAAAAAAEAARKAADTGLDVGKAFGVVGLLIAAAVLLGKAGR